MFCVWSSIQKLFLYVVHFQKKKIKKIIVCLSGFNEMGYDECSFYDATWHSDLIYSALIAWIAHRAQQWYAVNVQTSQWWHRHTSDMPRCQTRAAHEQIHPVILCIAINTYGNLTT